MTLYAFFRAIAAIFTSLDTALKFAGLSVQAFITYTGEILAIAEDDFGSEFSRLSHPSDLHETCTGLVSFRQPYPICI